MLAGSKWAAKSGLPHTFCANNRWRIYTCYGIKRADDSLLSYESETAGSA
jgi:hypothetical protein